MGLISSGACVKGAYMGLLQQKRGLVLGVANERSLACAIARAARAEGAELVITYQSDRFARFVAPIAESLRCRAIACDLGVDQQIEALVQALKAEWDSIDFVVHAVAFADAQEMQGGLLKVSRSGFCQSLDASVYSLIAITRALEPLLNGAAAPSILTLSHEGSRRAVPGYSTMGVAKAALESTVRYLAAELGPRGIRVNALSPGPVKTLSAAAIRGLRTMLKHVAEQAPLRRNIDGEDVGRAALYLLSDLGRATTGEVIRVDNGYHLIGAPSLTEEA